MLHIAQLLFILFTGKRINKMHGSEEKSESPLRSSRVS